MMFILTTLIKKLTSVHMRWQNEGCNLNCNIIEYNVPNFISGLLEDDRLGFFVPRLVHV